MNRQITDLIGKLRETHSLAEKEYAQLILERTPESAQLLAELAVAERKRIYGNDVYIRGLIEFTNICRNDCLYCGIRKSNRALPRYSLSHEEILSCCDAAWRLGLRTFVLQGGEDPSLSDTWLTELLPQGLRQFSLCTKTTEPRGCKH